MDKEEIMRIRYKKWARPELEESKFFIKEPRELKGKWNEEFKNNNPIYLELGCGRGGFLAQNCVKNKDVNQHNLNFHKRKNIYEVINLKDDFSSIEDKKILLVDDIMTTGGTMKRCLELVKSQRPKKIKILVLAKRELSKEEKEVYKKEALDYI